MPAAYSTRSCGGKPDGSSARSEWRTTWWLPLIRREPYHRAEPRMAPYPPEAAESSTITVQLLTAWGSAARCSREGCRSLRRCLPEQGEHRGEVADEQQRE